MITPETNTRNRLILQLLFFCGLRVSELTILLWGDIKDNGSNACAHITGKVSYMRDRIGLAPGRSPFLTTQRG
ncbi:hypothetical protein ACE09Y_07410 [Raphidiopsis sp. BLCC-F218]